MVDVLLTLNWRAFVHQQELRLLGGLTTLSHNSSPLKQDCIVCVYANFRREILLPRITNDVLHHEVEWDVLVAEGSLSWLVL